MVTFLAAGYYQFVCKQFAQVEQPGVKQVTSWSRKSDSTIMSSGHSHCWANSRQCTKGHTAVLWPFSGRGLGFVEHNFILLSFHLVNMSTHWTKAVDYTFVSNLLFNWILLLLWILYDLVNLWMIEETITTILRLSGFCPELPGWAVTRKVKPKPIWIFWSKRQWMAMLPAGPNANLHLAPER